MDKLDKLEQLANLRERGVLDESEFQIQKQRLLSADESPATAISPIPANVPATTKPTHSKVTAVLLALFFGAFSYLYLPKLDVAKFVGTVFFEVLCLGLMIGFASHEPVPGVDVYGHAYVHDMRPAAVFPAMAGAFVWGFVPLAVMSIRTGATYAEYDDTRVDWNGKTTK